MFVLFNQQWINNAPWAEDNEKSGAGMGINRLRLGYGQFHQSNNGLFSVNPGHDGNGFNISYAWYWRTSKW